MSNNVTQRQADLQAAQARLAEAEQAMAQAHAQVKVASRALSDALGAPAIGTIVPLKAGSHDYPYNWLGVKVESRGRDPEHPNEWKISDLIHQVSKWGSRYSWDNMVDRQMTLTQREFERLPEAVRHSTADTVLASVYAAQEKAPRRGLFRRR